MKSIDHVFVVRGAVLSLEIVLLSFFAYYIWPLAIAAIYISLLCVEILFSIAPAYHLNVQSASLWLQQIKSFTPLASISIYMSLFVLGLAVYVASRTIKRFSLSKTSMVLIGSMVMGLVAIDRFIEGPNKKNLVSSTVKSLFQFVGTAGADLHDSNFSAESELIDSASGALYQSIRSNDPLPDKIIIVVVESLGWASEELNSKQFSQILSQGINSNDYRLSIEDITFSGSTVPGEIRELCQRKISTVTPDFSEVDVSFCLPKTLSSLGYSTFAIHGYTGGFFNRIAWYSDLGFQQIYFGNTLRANYGLNKKCGSLLFTGVCDAEIGDLIRNKLLGNSERQFFYWLTLNGHQPVIHSPEFGQYEACDAMRLNHDSLCWTIQYAQVVMNEVVSIVNSSPGTGVVVVGDHSPGGLKDEFDNHKVPGIIIWPNQ